MIKIPVIRVLRILHIFDTKRHTNDFRDIKVFEYQDTIFTYKVQEKFVKYHIFRQS